MRALLRKKLIDLLAALGVFRLFRFLNRNKVAILFYHGVSEAERFEGIRNYQGKHVRLSRFREHLDFLSRHYRVLPLPEVVDALRRGTRLPAHAAVITFDDGYENNATVALPALREDGLPATFFLSASLIGTEHLLWVDEIEQVLASTDRTELKAQTKNGVERLSLRTDEERRAADIRLRAIGKNLPEILKRKWLEDFFAGNGLERPEPEGDYRFMTWDQVQALRDAGMTIGSHTLTHAIVTRLHGDLRVWEVIGAKRACEEKLREPCDTFAYPNGRVGDFDEKTSWLLEGLEFSCGLTTVNGLAAVGDDPFRLPRIGVGDGTSVSELEAQTSGFMAFAIKLLARLRR